MGMLRRSFSFGAILLATTLFAASADTDQNLLIGRGKADITGPARGVQMWGFVREDQITEGIHQRQWARAFVIAEPDGGNRIAFVTVDMGSVTPFVHWEVVERLQNRFGGVYDEANVIVSATHTHAGPGGYWHYGTTSPLGGAFYQEYFDAIVDGIVASIAQAHADLEPGDIFIAHGEVTNAGAQRSATAYLNNPEEERARYESDTDTTMTLLRFVKESGTIGILNWFAVHPTAMTYNNRLISGDHKGYAAYALENSRPDGFVAAFAQSNCGDVTANLNLDNTGPGKDDFETTRIIGDRQVEMAMRLAESASERLGGEIDYRHAHVDFRYLPVSETYTGVSGATTCPSAYGYAFAAGSTEDGGGHPMFREGMKQSNAMIDNLVSEQFQVPAPSERCRECHGVKPILFATGETDPPGYPQILPISLVRIGQLAIVAVPAEFTTMAGRRLRHTVREHLGDAVDHIVLAGYANGYAGYVTTPEEYETQQYEGGHTLYGPWTLPAYRQEFARLASAMAAAEAVEPGPRPSDIRDDVTATPLAPDAVAAPREALVGDVVEQPKKSYAAGEQVTAVFWSSDPRTGYRTGSWFAEVQHREGDEWRQVATDDDWSTKIRWLVPEGATEGLHATISWDIPEAAPGGEYRIVHRGIRSQPGGELMAFAASTREFRVR